MVEWVVYGGDASKQPDFSDASNTTTRRHHSKSRTGCNVCKQRRIKCDETRPACRQCLDYGRHCSFLDKVSASAVSTSLGADELDVVVEQVWNKLKARIDLYPGTNEVILARSTLRALLGHFVNYDADWLGQPVFQKLVQRHGIDLGLRHEYLLHALLAVSALHLQHQGSAIADLDRIGHCHYQFSLQLYQTELQNLRPENLDPVYACSLLQTITSFRTTLLETAAGSQGEFLPGFNLVIATVKTMYSFPALFQPFQGQQALLGNIFAPLFDRCNFPQSSSVRDDPDLPPDTTIAPLEGPLRDMLGDRIFDTVYKEPFVYLVRISKQGPESDNLDIDVAFSSQLRGEYLTALEAQDPVAILFLCYWFALLSRIRQWWLEQPSRTVCEQLFVHLLGALPVEPLQERMKLLQPAATAIGWGVTQ